MIRSFFYLSSISLEIIARRVFISVINDLVTDQRVHKLAFSLSERGMEVVCIGRKFRKSPPVSSVAFRVRRMRFLINRGPVFYACFNLRLFLLHLFSARPSLIIANDLDTLLACYLAARIRKIPLVYDSHEYFTQVPELINRERTRDFWLFLEGFLLRRIKHAITVSSAIAEKYQEKYGLGFTLVRNVPFRLDAHTRMKAHPGKEEHRIIYQGSLNIGRGLELLITSMQFMNDTRLILAGTGDIDHQLRQLANDLDIAGKVEFMGRILPGELIPLTCSCDLGVSLEEDMGLNYRYALPNKIFDYIQCRIPVLCSDLPEMAQLVTSYGVGMVVKKRDPEILAAQMAEMLEKGRQGCWQDALERSADDLCWEKEVQQYLLVMENSMKDI